MKILGIGNAIIDVICKVDDNFLKKNDLTKGTMKLVNQNEFKTLTSELKIEETISGGSVANSIVGLSQLNNEVGFIGKINNDKFGNEYEKGLKKEKVKFLDNYRLEIKEDKDYFKDAKIYRCDDCEFGFVDPMPNKETLNDFYENV